MTAPYGVGRWFLTALLHPRNHRGVALIKGNEVAGGILYRLFNDRGFAEIVFCAISSSQQGCGYGGHLMNHFKDHVLETSQARHFLTYADNDAIGYFQKQGFTVDVTLDKLLWMGYIKDYEGSTIMQVCCKSTPPTKLHPLLWCSYSAR